jgi:SAM-dependent methyltransferase
MEPERSLDKWTSGEAYERWMGRWSRLLADKFLSWLNIPAAARWLDVCCGSGVVTQAIVEHCSLATVSAIDASPEQIAFSRVHCSSPHVRYEVADAMALPFDDACFDVAVSGLGLNFVLQPERALHEMRRVTRSGGTIAAYVWDYAQGARFLREFWDAASELDPEASAFDQGRRFPLCAPHPLRSLFEKATLRKVTLESLKIQTRFANFEDYWEPFSAGQGSAPNYLAMRSDDIRKAIRERLRAALPRDSNGMIALPARAWAILANCP